MGIEHPLLANGMTDPQDGSPEDLAGERLGMDDRTYISHGEKICDLVFAGFGRRFCLLGLCVPGDPLAFEGYMSVASLFRF